eukprot:Phypoly_transcript_09077.p1 GENE.Phypoly_transcript_09077~~Phypoly_transcript_09077.p1  ORF type:complete len:364 (+),score=72.97 Phypoly_transcript_09077:177-1268(+)
MLLQAVRRAVNRCTGTSLLPCPTQKLCQKISLCNISCHKFNSTRFYCMERKRPEVNGSSEIGVDSQKKSGDSHIDNAHNTTGTQEKRAGVKSEGKVGGIEGDKTNEGADRTAEGNRPNTGEGNSANTGEGNKTNPGEGEQVGEKNSTNGTGEGAKTGEKDNTSGAGEGQGQEEPLPPWWGSLPIWKKILYPSLAISIVSLITELVYASTLRTTLPYKQAIHIIRNVDEIEEAFGEIKEPKWHQFWDVLYGYWWVQASGYEGVSKLWLPIVGVKEYKTDQVDKNGEPVMKQTFTRGRAYVEAKKEGAGETEWVLTYLVVKGDKLGTETRKSDDEWLDVNHEELPKPIKGQMVLVDRHVQIDGDL